MRAAYRALSEFWLEPSQSPNLEGVDEVTKADVLLRIGALAGWLAARSRLEDSQETAKHLITRTLVIFEKLGIAEKIAEARGDLGLCYWREGSKLCE